MAERLGERLRSLRHAHGLRRVDAARAANVTSTWLSRVERGHIPRPDPEALARLAALFGVSVQELLGGAPERRTPSLAAASQAEQNRARIEDLVVEVVNHGNFAVADLVLASTYMLHGPSPDASLSREQFKRLMERMRRAFPDINVRIDEVIASADRVVVRWMMTGTHTGSVRDVAPTGASVSHAGIAIFGMESGRVTEAWMAADASDRELFRRLGLMT